MKHILVLAQVYKPQRIYNIFLEIPCPNELKELSKLKSNTYHMYLTFQTSSPTLPCSFILL